LAGDGLTLLPSGVVDVTQLEDPVWIETNLGPNDAWYFPGTFVANPLDRLELVRVARTAVYQEARKRLVATVDEPGSEPFELVLRILNSFSAQVRADGATPVVLILPGEGEVFSTLDGRPHRNARLVSALDRLAVPTVDLVPYVAEQARQHDFGEVVRGHLRAVGNLAVARALADRLPALTAATCDWTTH
jgi:hypothetical protein